MKTNLKSQWYIWMMLPLMGYLASCGSDDGDNPAAPAQPESFVTFNGQTYELTNGYLEDYGSNDPLDSYDIDIFFTDQPFDVVNYLPADNAKVVVFLDLNTTQDGVLVPGTYTLGTVDDDMDGFTDRLANTITDAVLVTDIVLDEDGELDEQKSNYFDEPTAASATVTVQGSQYTITYELTFDSNTKISGTFKGTLTRIQ